MKPVASREAFAHRTRDWADRLDVRVRAVTVRKMRKKWASCSTAGRLTFDEALLEMPADLQDYVIVHELVHVSVPNHGRLWKSLMRAHLGDYEALEARLQQSARTLQGIRKAVAPTASPSESAPPSSASTPSRPTPRCAPRHTAVITLKQEGPTVGD